MDGFQNSRNSIIYLVACILHYYIFTFKMYAYEAIDLHCQHTHSAKQMGQHATYYLNNFYMMWESNDVEIQDKNIRIKWENRYQKYSLPSGDRGTKYGGEKGTLSNLKSWGNVIACKLH